MTSFAKEEIPAGDLVSRHVDSPDKWLPEERIFVELRLFMFQRPEEVESVVWRKYAPLLSDVHTLGCDRQKVRREDKPHWTYEGAITATVADIREIQTPVGDGFEVLHDPDEGVHHAHIKYRLAQVQDGLRQRKLDLKERLRKSFGALDSHACT